MPRKPVKQYTSTGVGRSMIFGPPAYPGGRAAPDIRVTTRVPSPNGGLTISE